MVNRRQLLKLTAIGTASFAAPTAYSKSEITMTFNTGNPVPSTDPRDLYDNATNLDKFANGQDLEYPDRLGVPRKSLAGIRAEVTEALSRLGYQVLGDYAAGLVVQNYGQVIRKDGEFYRAAASLDLPYALTGDWAAESASFVSVGDAVLRQELATNSGAEIVGTVAGKLSSALQAIPFGHEYDSTAKDWGAGQIESYEQLVIHGGIFYKYIGTTLPKAITGPFEAEPANTWMRIDSDLSAYASPATKKTDLTPKIGSGYRVVITGDSLSFNAFEFASSVPLLPADYAYKNPYGLASWGHMMRDSIYASTYDFTLAKNCQITYTSGVVEATNINDVYTSPFNNQLRSFAVSSDTDEIKIRMNNVFSGASVRLMFFTGLASAAPIAKFDIYTAGVLRASVDLQGDPETYTGRYQLNIDNIPMSGDTEITLRNVVKSDGTAGTAIVQFIGYTTVTPDVHMTGHGSWTSGQVLADYENMVGQYSPDLVFYIIGANDVGLGVPVATFKANVESFVKNVRQDRANADIVLISSTPTTWHPSRYSAMGDYIDALYQLAVKHRLYFKDLYEVFEGADPSAWRYDDVHTSIVGGNHIYKAVRDLVFPTMRLAEEYVADAQYQVVTGVTQPESKITSVLVSFDSNGNPLVPAAAAKLVSVGSTAAGKVTITPRGNLSVSAASWVVAPSAGQFYLCLPEVIELNGVITFATMNVANNPPAAVTSKSQIAGQSMMLTIGDRRTY